MNNLAIFDIDGTLVRTGMMNHNLYFQIFEEQYGINLGDLDWSQARFSTDSGLMPFVFEQAWHRPPKDEEIAEVRKVFKAYWVEYLGSISAEEFAVPGAAEAVAMLREHDSWQVAVASGGWRALGQAKLASIGIETDSMPSAFADDAPARSQIITISHERAKDIYQKNEFDRVVYLGDAFWDVSAAARLGLGFVGIGADDDADKLRKAGAKAVIADYLDSEDLPGLLGEAPVPTLGEAVLD